MNVGNNKLKLKNYGTFQYEYVWEHMVKKVYGNEKVEKYFSNSKYLLLGFDQIIVGSNLRPDSIFTNEKDIYILDSKYYKYGITKNTFHLPNTDSVQK